MDQHLYLSRVDGVSNRIFLSPHRHWLIRCAHCDGSFPDFRYLHQDHLQFTITTIKLDRSHQPVKSTPRAFLFSNLEILWKTTGQRSAYICKMALAFIAPVDRLCSPKKSIQA